MVKPTTVLRKGIGKVLKRPKDSQGRLSSLHSIHHWVLWSVFQRCSRLEIHMHYVTLHNKPLNHWCLSLLIYTKEILK